MSAHTIYALATAQGIAGVAVIRISGSHALAALQALSMRDDVPPARKTALRYLYDVKEDGQRIKLDHAMVIYFEGPASYTGEDVVELHLHGGPVVVESVLRALSRLEYTRLAAPGEFTRRAFENDKLDLTEAEAVGDLIHAETQAQQELALNQLEGALSKKYEEWRSVLSKLLAYCEAEIDFPDEDLPDSLIDTLKPEIKALLDSFNGLLGHADKAQKMRKGISITLVGAPNAGKSSLLNCLAQDDVAIVTDLAGTTRDILDVRMNIGGYAVTLSDTAGLRDMLDTAENAHNAIEAEGIRRALKRAKESDYRILVIDAYHDDIDNAIEQHKDLIDEETIICLNKVDLTDQLKTQALEGHPFFAISTLTHEGIPELLQAIEERLKKDFRKNDNMLLTRARHREALLDAKICLERAISALGGDELLAEDLRLALRALGRITGRVDVEDLLDIVFRDFCIGK